MELLGIGLPELIFIALILLLVLGPTELVTLGRKTGRLVRRIRSSETWTMITSLAVALRNLPNALADEAGADEIFRDVMPNRTRRKIEPPGRGKSDRASKSEFSDSQSQDGYSAWTTPPSPGMDAGKPEAQEPGTEDSPDNNRSDSDST